MFRLFVVVLFYSFWKRCLGTSVCCDFIEFGCKGELVKGKLKCTGGIVSFSGGIVPLNYTGFCGSGISTLDLTANSLLELPPTVFNNLPNLTVLDLGRQSIDKPNALDNQITTLPEGIFSRTTSLVRLNLLGINLTYIFPTVFALLTNLENLDLGYNRLTALPAHVFDSLVSLSELYIDNNELSTLPAHLFDTLRNLRTIWINGNHIVSFPACIFFRLVYVNSDLQVDPPPVTCPPGTIKLRDNFNVPSHCEPLGRCACPFGCALQSK
jgi:Leucine-rich repeat (LRR) protein